jgi:hypothetical protein
MRGAIPPPPVCLHGMVLSGQFTFSLYVHLCYNEGTCFNCHEGVFGSGDIAPCILDLGTR